MITDTCEQTSKSRWDTKIFRLATVALFILGLLLPETLVLFNYPASSTPKPNFSMAIFQSPSALFNFARELKQSLEDRFGGRDLFIQANSFLRRKVINEAVTPSVLIGKDEWLFYDSGAAKDGLGFSGLYGGDPLNLEQLEKTRQNLEQQSEWFKSKNILFFILICPDKQSIYPENLPRRMKQEIRNSRLDQFYTHMKNFSKFDVDDLRPQMIEHKNGKSTLLYYRYDSHWNTIGAFYGYESIMQKLTQEYPKLSPLRWGDFQEDTEISRIGDLSNMSKIPQTYLEHGLILKNGGDEKISEKLEKLLLFGDSFSPPIVDLLKKHFNEIKVIRGGRSGEQILDKEQIELYRPNVVIWESVERYWTNIGKT